MNRLRIFWNCKFKHLNQCCCQGPEVRGQGLKAREQGQELVVRGQRQGLRVQGHGQGLKQREGHQCLECKFTTHKYFRLLISVI